MEKKNLTLKRYNDELFYLRSKDKYEENEYGLLYLSTFLTDDVQYCSGTERWKRLINNLKDEECTGGNFSHIVRVGDKLIISCGIKDEEEEEEENSITYEITIKNLLDVLDQWEQLCKERPQEIWIFEENGKVWLEGKN